MESNTGGFPLVVIVGPTAIGKTEVAMKLANLIDGEIINADSMQVYTGMNIGTAKPSRSDRSAVPFYLVDVASPRQQFTVADWKAAAELALGEIKSRQLHPILCGGTGLYIRSLLENWSHAGTEAAPSIRDSLDAIVRQHGSPALHQELLKVDVETAQRLHPNDAVRIIRAMEVYQSTGTPLSQILARERIKTERLKALSFGLILPRDQIYQRIDRRVDKMIAEGFESEVRELLEQNVDPMSGPMKSLGYKEMIQYLSGELTHKEMVEATKQNTRRYAKRQLTWFRADHTIRWIDVSDLSSAEVAHQITAILAGPS